MLSRAKNGYYFIEKSIQGAVAHDAGPYAMAYLVCATIRLCMGAHVLFNDEHLVASVFSMFYELSVVRIGLEMAADPVFS